MPAARSVALYLPATLVIAVAALGFVLLLTPTGSLPSPRWRWWARAAAAAPVVSVVAVMLARRNFDQPYQPTGNPLDLSDLSGALLVIYQLAFAVTNLAVVVGAVSLVVRFRRARGGERQQLRWVALAAALASVGSLVVVVASAMGTNAPLLGWVAGVYVAVLPVAIGAAIFRYRLYDLDRIISRTLAYALLTALLAGGYAAVVLGLGRLLPDSSSLAVAAATLAVAALFQPFRRRIQQTVDRRFNRRRHDAAQTIEAFSARLRDQLDLDTLEAELLSVVTQTMQPTRASIWLRPATTRSRPGPAGGETRCQARAGPSTLTVDSPRPARTRTRSDGSAELLRSRCTTPLGT